MAPGASPHCFGCGDLPRSLSTEAADCCKDPKILTCAFGPLPALEELPSALLSPRSLLVVMLGGFASCFSCKELPRPLGRAALPQHGQRAPPHTKVLACLPARHVPNAPGADRQGRLWWWSQQSLEQGKGSPGEQGRLQGDAPAPQVWGHWEPWCPHSPASPQPCLCSARSLLPPCAELGLSVMPSRPGSVWSYKNPAPGLPAAPPLRAQLLTPVSAGGSVRPRGRATVCQQPRTSLLFSCTEPP